MDHIGPYRLLKLIRAGSATHVWEAMDSVEQHRVAIKSLQPEYRHDKHQIAVLRHEFTVGRSLDHPNVNRVLDFNIARDIPYVVLQYFPAPNLKQIIRQYPERITQFMPQILEQTASGLHHLHERGWIHRDVKPDNFLMNEEGEIRLIDFAIGQRIKKPSGLGKFFGSKQKVMGTRSYMSPEQIRGEFLDQRADIYSLGCVYYELFVGRPPYTGNNSDDLLNKHLRASVPTIISQQREVTLELSRLVARMMAKKPSQRPDSLRDVVDELNQIRIYTARVS